MKSNQILMAGALALSMILSGCSAMSTSEDVKDVKTTDTAKKADSKKSTKEDAKTSTKDKKESPKTETNKNTAEAVGTKEASNSENKKVEVQTQNSQQHTHNWVAVTETRTVVDQPAYDEQVPVTEMREICVGNQSGLQISGDPNEYLLNNSNGDSGWHSEWREEVTGYQTVHHDAVTHTETVTTGYKCSTCGATK